MLFWWEHLFIYLFYFFRWTPFRSLFKWAICMRICPQKGCRQSGRGSEDNFQSCFLPFFFPLCRYWVKIFLYYTTTFTKLRVQCLYTGMTVMFWVFFNWKISLWTSLLVVFPYFHCVRGRGFLSLLLRLLCSHPEAVWPRFVCDGQIISQLHKGPEAEGGDPGEGPVTHTHIHTCTLP